MYLLEKQNETLVPAEIRLGTLKEMPLKKEGWNFNWRFISKKENTSTYILTLKSNTSSIQGALHLKESEGMLIMDLVEIAPNNIGKKKKYDYVAGCLIAFACRESFKLETNYKGFLTFESKTKLIGWYSEKYGAKVAMGQKMYIEPNQGLKLMDEYLKREK